ncbi:MAG: hypothetical protein Devi2KO_39940 [Devosia indica]
MHGNHVRGTRAALSTDVRMTFSRTQTWNRRYETAALGVQKCRNGCMSQKLELWIEPKPGPNEHPEKYHFLVIVHFT